MSGGGLATKGVVGGSATVVETEEVALPPPPDLVQSGAHASQQQIVIVVPTAPNICLMASENIVENLRVRQAANLELPSLYKRAYLIAHETDEIAVVKG